MMQDVSSEFFQRHLQQTLESLYGVVCVADDILLYGATKEKYDDNFIKLLERCVSRNIRLKKEKFENQSYTVAFHCHVLTSEGLKPNPWKVRAIVAMPKHVDAKAATRLNAMVAYISRFMPNLADVIRPIRLPTYKDVA